MTTTSTTSTTSTTTTTTTKIIVLDDDPTGSQTVHSCQLLTKWDKDTLMQALLDDTSPIFFVLTNTRGMSGENAAILTREVCHNLKLALQQQPCKNINPIIVSRSDSTLRGHYPIETNVISDELGPFHAHFIIPAFFEGGRITLESTHYIRTNNNNNNKDEEQQETELIPCHETEFAKDSVFGYSTSYLPDYVEEKTNGNIKSNQVERFLLDVVRDTGNNNDNILCNRLTKLSNNVCCVVDCEIQSDLNNFASNLKQVAASTGHKFLFRSGASLLTALAQLPPQPIPANQFRKYLPKERQSGVIVVGSHVQKSTKQLNELLKLPNIIGIEVNVHNLQHQQQQDGTAVNDDKKDTMFKNIKSKIHEVHSNGKHPVIYTSRTELTQFSTNEERLEFGSIVSSFLMSIVHNLPQETTGFIISKGGITSNDVLSTGLELKTSRVLGQILPGCSVVQCPPGHNRYPNIPVVIFPGNVGDEYGLVTVFQRLTTTSTN